MVPYVGVHTGGEADPAPEGGHTDMMDCAGLFFRRNKFGNKLGNKFGTSELPIMPKSKSPSTGPMRMQPVQRGSILPTPMMPTARTAAKTPAPKQQPTRTEAIRAAKARITRRNSLRKHSEGLTPR